MNKERRQRLVRDGEIFDMEDVERGFLLLPEPPPPRPEPPVSEQHERWARLADLDQAHPVRRWVRERLGGHGRS